MANPFASNVHQDIVNQAQQDQLLQAAMRGDPQAIAQMEAIVFQNPQLGEAARSQKDSLTRGLYGVTPENYIKGLSQQYIQARTGRYDSPVYYDPARGGLHDQQKDSKLFKVAQYGPGIVGGAMVLGPALLGGQAAAGGGAAAPEIGLGGESLTVGLGGAGAVGPGGGLAGGLGTAGGLGAVADITGELAPSTGTISGGVPQALGPGGGGGWTSLVGNKSSMLGPLLNTGLRLGSAAIGSHAAGKASEQQQQNIQKGLDLQANLYGQSRAALMPYYQLGAGSLGRLGSFLGTQPAAPIPAGTLGNLGK